MIYWDFSQYNSIVKAVEECGDKLNALAEIVGNTIVEVPNGAAKNMLVRLVKLAKHIDWEAVKMMAEYDSYARRLKRHGIRRDPRRSQTASIFRTDIAVSKAMMPLPAGGRPEEAKAKTSRRVAKKKA
jgi:hypothetical protein